MYTTQIESIETLEVKQSKFIAHLLPFSDYEEKLQKLKQQHPKARHFVVAYRYLNEYGQIVEHSSDDGEPKGTSGKPSLMVLQGRELINVAVIVVRYFGGTKLGTGGLVRAYSDAVNLVIDAVVLVPYVEQVLLRIEIAYSDVRYVEYECKCLGVTIVEKQFGERITFGLRTDKETMEQFLTKVARVVKTTIQ